MLEFIASWLLIAAGACFGWWLIRSAQDREHKEQEEDEDGSYIVRR